MVTTDGQRLAESAALYQRGEFAALVDRIAADEPDAALTQLRAQALGRLGKRSDAAGQFARAARAHAQDGSVNASLCVANAVALWGAAGDSAAATQLAFESLLYAESCDLQPGTLQYLFKDALTARDGTQLTAIVCAGAGFAATRELCLSTLLDMATQPAAYGIAVDDTGATMATSPASFVSVVVCSNDDERYARFERECADAMTAGAYELVRIADASSMADGYGRGLAITRGELIAFCHDDIEFLSADLPACLELELDETDVLVSVGGRDLVGPTWSSGGPLRLQGWMAAPSADGYTVGIAGVPDRRYPLATGDGCFIAMRRDTALRLGWESGASSGFHLYDLDLCARAADAGLRVGATRLIALNHLSYGHYGDAWRSAAEHFLKARGIEGFVMAANPWVTALAVSRDEASRRLRTLARLVPANWPDVIRQRATQQSSRRSAVSADALGISPTVAS